VRTGHHNHRLISINSPRPGREGGERIGLRGYRRELPSFLRPPTCEREEREKGAGCAMATRKTSRPFPFLFRRRGRKKRGKRTAFWKGMAGADPFLLPKRGERSLQPIAPGKGRGGAAFSIPSKKEKGRGERKPIVLLPGTTREDTAATTISLASCAGGKKKGRKRDRCRPVHQLFLFSPMGHLRKRRWHWPYR